MSERDRKRLPIPSTVVPPSDAAPILQGQVRETIFLKDAVLSTSGDRKALPPPAISKARDIVVFSQSEEKKSLSPEISPPIYTEEEKNILSTLETNRKNMLLTAFRMLGNYHDAEEIVQDTWEKIWNKRDTYHPQEGTSPRAWSLSILKRMIIDEIRRKKRRVEEVDLGKVIESNRFTGYVEDGSETVFQNETRQEVENALAPLPSQLRRILELRYLEDLSYAQIAEKLGESIKKIEIRLWRARKKFRNSDEAQRLFDTSE